MKIYTVGGFVRDQMLGVASKDRDWVVVGATPQQMLDLGFIQVGKDFPVFLHPKSKQEYALARTERKVAPGYKGFAVYANSDVSLEQDLRRRDLTINAMALDKQGRLVDPYAGKKDLDKRILRHVSAAFVEDPVRILRLARFAARLAPFGFRVAADTQALLCEMVDAGEVNALVAERVWQEIKLALQTQRPTLFFQVLRSCGALARILPEVDCLFGVPQNIVHHPEIDCGIHTLLVLEQACALSEDNTVRFAALTHDLGKGATPAWLWPKHPDHEQLGLPILANMCARLAVPNDYCELARLVARYHGVCHRIFSNDAAGIVDLFYRLDLWRRPGRLQPFLLACQADSLGRAGFAHRAYPQARLLLQAMAACQKVTTTSLRQKGLKGQQFGAQLRRLRIAAVVSVLC